jgi:hypothetical protein
MNVKLVLPLNKMTTSDKLSAMGQLWDELCRSPQVVPSPAWHGEILSDREKRVRKGRARFSDLADAKDRIRKATR